MKPSYKPAVVLPQIEDFVQTHMSRICSDMKRMEDKDREAEVLFYEWHLLGRRPKVRDSRHFINMMNVSLCLQLSDNGFHLRDVEGIADHMTLSIVWFPQR